MLCEIAHRVAHVLMRSRDAARRGVVVRAKVRRDDAAVAFRDETWQRDAAIRRKDRLRRLDHQFELQRQPGDVAPVFEGIARRRQRRDLLGRRDLRQRHHEIRRESTAALFQQRRKEQIEGTQAPALQFLAERLDADAD
jgi:hypothetical protein